MSERRALLWIRLAVGAGFMYQGLAHVNDMRLYADVFAAHTGWTQWPVVGGMRPLEVVLWLAFVEFFLGVFLFGGLLTRILSAPALLVTALQVVATGLAGGPANPLLALGSAALLFRGGGAGTMDATLGDMQRRSLEREAERQAAKRGP